MIQSSDSNQMKIVKDKITLLTVLIVLLNIFVGQYLLTKYLGQTITLSEKDSLEATISLSAPTVPVTENITDQAAIHTVRLTVKVTNNTNGGFTNVRMLIPSIGMGTLESPSAPRFAYLQPITTEHVFSLGFLPPGETVTGYVLLYYIEKKTYTIRVNILSDEKAKAITNIVTLTAE